MDGTGWDRKKAPEVLIEALPGLFAKGVSRMEALDYWRTDFSSDSNFGMTSNKSPTMP